MLLFIKFLLFILNKYRLLDLTPIERTIAIIELYKSTFITPRRCEITLGNALKYWTEFYRNLSQHFAGTWLERKICLKKIVESESAHKTAFSIFYRLVSYLEKKAENRSSWFNLGSLSLLKEEKSSSKSLLPKWIWSMTFAGKKERKALYL